jgi:hypothetical protein
MVFAVKSILMGQSILFGLRQKSNLSKSQNKIDGEFLKLSQ